jgi:hypothetical protein
MNNNLPTAVLESQHNPNPIELSGSDAPARQNSVLASILESVANDNKRIGYAFHTMNQGHLERRGIVLDETSKTYTVSFCDVFGMPSEMKKVSKERTTSWKWFVDVEHSNVVYDKLFGVQ